jgi:2-keto-4-pentenoate hydratase/2-oxohepta-3-ene-1,7-dioic acid hydratase in catechol pathway
LCGEPVDADIDGEFVHSALSSTRIDFVQVGFALAAKEKVSVKVLKTSSALDSGAQFTGEVTTISKLLPPLSAQEIGTIRCVGLNFKDHAAELGCALPEVPTIFTKPSTALSSALDPIVLPRSAPKAVDSEVELAVVIGRDCKDVSPTEAMDYVLGYTIANDLTARDLQSQTSQWGYCKGFDGFCPLGPVIASQRAVGNVRALKMKTELDGQILQDSSADQMIFSVGEMVSHLSRVSPAAHNDDMTI